MIDTRQGAALPAEALAAYAVLRLLLETSPWSRAPYHRDIPGGALRCLPSAPAAAWSCTCSWTTSIGPR